MPDEQRVEPVILDLDPDSISCDEPAGVPPIQWEPVCILEGCRWLTNEEWDRVMAQYRRLERTLDTDDVERLLGDVDPPVRIPRSDDVMIAPQLD